MNKLIINLFKGFLSGSNILVTMCFYYGFNYLKSQYNIENMKKITGDYIPFYIYAFLAPCYLGLISTITIFISVTFNINFRYVFFIMSIISPTLVQLFIKYFDVYNFSKERWLKQYIYLLISHMAVYNIIIANIYSLLS